MEDLLTASEAIVGREAELAAIDALLASLAAGHPVFAELVGEPGIGKTTLLSALAERATESGHLVLRGRASQFEAETPFDPFVDALDDYLAGLNPRRLEALGSGRLAELAAAFPALVEVVEGERVQITGEERYRIHRATRELLRTIAAVKPLVLILDDAHWCDQASFELLHHLLRRPPSGPVLTAIAYRNGTMPASWQRIADAAVREGDLIRIEVGPLSRGDADALIAGEVDDPGLRDRVFEAAGGNPFFMRQVAAAPQVVVASNAAVRGREGVPEAVVAAIVEELATLADPEREAIWAAAVAGDPFDPSLAAAAAGVEEVELLPQLDALGRRDLIRPGDSPREFQFRHPLVWRGVREGTPAGWRIQAHRRLSDYLASRGASATARAPHVEAAAQRGDLAAAAVLREAAEASIVQAPASAVHWFDAALRLLPEGPELGQERIEVLLAMASALGSTGRLAESRDRLREVLARIPRGAGQGRIKAVVSCATMENLLRSPGEATRLLTEELASLDDPESEEAAEVLLALATLNAFAYESEEAREWGRQALELARRHNLRSVEASASAALALNEMRMSERATEPALLDRAVALVEALDRETPTPPIEPLFWVVVPEMYVGRFEDSLRHAGRVEELARARQQGRWLPQIAASKVWSLWFLGRLQEAIAVTQEGLEMAELTGNRQFETLMQIARCVVLTPAGRLREALDAAARAIELGGPPSQGDYLSMWSRQYAAMPALASGDPKAARRLMYETLDESFSPYTEGLWYPVVAGTAVEAELQLGDLDAAERHAQWSAEFADRFPLAGRPAMALHARALVELARGNAAGAAAAARDSADQFAEARFPIEEGRCHAVAGRALAQAGDRDAGVRELERAVKLLGSHGAVHYRDQAARELRRLGVRVSRPGRHAAVETGLDALSEREREIAELVSDGMTNKQIAHALYLSPKTVDKHLASVFRKLGVNKRAAVAAKLGQR